MRQAIELASVHHPHPNPRVGAVVFDRHGEVVGRGAHVAAGMPHAEAVALADAGTRAAGGTLVVTLEPHDHQGRTPPCTEAIITAGLARVVIGVEDPDVRVHGRGVERLKSAGIEVDIGVESAACEALDPGYFHHRRTGRARTVLKTASTLDGQTAAADGSSKWITGEEARRDGHRLRADADAVMVGAGTVLADDPQLNARIEDVERQPRPVVIVGTRALPATARIWERDPIIAAPIPLMGVDQLIVAPGSSGRVDLGTVLETLPGFGILDVLIEGGAGLAAALWEEGLVDAGVSYLAPRLAGGVGRAMFDRPFTTLDEARPISVTAIDTVGDDLRLTWVPRRD